MYIDIEIHIRINIATLIIRARLIYEMFETSFRGEWVSSIFLLHKQVQDPIQGKYHC